jgi:predicted regulator of Ras-like GTPase activity (Roadblock/LC7/MglB family)
MLDSLTEDVRNFNWLLTSFVDQSAGVCDSVAVSSDGLLMAMSRTLDRAGAERVAAIISGLVSLGRGAARSFGFQPLNQVVVAMDGGYLFVSSISDGSSIGVVATKRCDIGLVGHQTALLIERVAPLLTPALVAELRSTVMR